MSGALPKLRASRAELLSDLAAWRGPRNDFFVALLIWALCAPGCALAACPDNLYTPVHQAHLGVPQRAFCCPEMMNQLWFKQLREVLCYSMGSNHSFSGEV